MSCRLKYLFLLILVARLADVEAQVPFIRNHALPPEYRNTGIHTMVQDARGFIWLGTTHGPVKFDGVAYRHFIQDSTSENSVSAMFEDSRGILWVGLRSGTVRQMKDDVFLPFSPEAGFPKVAITGFAEDTSGNVWFSTYGEGLYVFRDGRLFNLNVKDGLNDNFIYCIVKASGGILAGTDHGIAVCAFDGQNKSIRKITTDNGLPDNIVTALARTDDGDIWIGMESAGVCAFDESNGTFSKSGIPWTHGRVTSITTWPDVVWAGTTNRGIIETDRVTLEHLPLSPHDAPRRILGSMKDREGNVWLWDGSGSSYSTNRTFTFLPGAGRLTANVQALLYTRDDKLVYSTGAQLNISDLKNSISSFSSLAGQNIISLFEDEQGSIWCGTFDQGVYRIDRNGRILGHYTQNDGLVNNNVLSISGSGRDIWLATLGGVTRITPGENAKLTFTNFTSENGLGSNFIYKVFVDSRSRVWFATDGKGITVLEGGAFRNFSLTEGLKSNIIYSVTEGSDGTIWLSTANSGIYRFTGERFVAFSPHNGLRDMRIASIVADRTGNILIVSRQGIDILNPKTGTIFYHGAELGISEIDPNLNAYTLDPKGNIWIGTQNAIIRYTTISPIPSWPVTRINRVMIFLAEPEDASDRTLAHDQNHVSFDYIGFWYHDPEEVTYRIRLEGYDREWISSRNRFVTYPSLPPGKYRFMVRSSATNHFEGAQVEEYAFEIRPPFYNTVWFYLAVALLSGGVLFLFIRKREQRAKLAERQKKEQVEFQFETLKSQVNPHFLFNSFNTLIAVIEEDPDTAVQYVEKLSDFYRNILLHREADVIPLEKEIALIDNYYFLQLKRYRNNFIVKVDIPEDKRSKHLPPLTLQLLVENAVKHNIISSQKPLTVEIFADGDYVAVRNNLQRKVHQEPSTGLGLSNIISRYRLLTEKPVRIEETGESFCVYIPLLNGKE